MHQVISLTGTPPSPLLLFLFVYFLAQFDVKQAEVSLASASDKADMPWEAGLRNGIKSGRGEMQMSSLARLSTVPPAPSKSSPLSLLLTVPSHYLSIFMPG